MVVKTFLVTLPRNLVACFAPRRLAWHVLAIGLTVGLVTSGFDWRYFQWTRSPVLRVWMFPAVHIGGLLPLVLPLTLLALGVLPAQGGIRRVGWAVAQAEIIGGIIAAFYKALTGRAHPMRHITSDLTRTFHFGFLRGGVFWGWPSSHTTIAFAMAVAVFTLTPNRRWLGYLAVAYALYVGIGVSMTIHWFSDFVAGTIFGSLVGLVIGRSFSLSPAKPLPATDTPLASPANGENGRTKP